MTGFARVSSVLDRFISAEQSSPSFAIACFESDSELVRLCLGSGICNLSSNRFFPRHIITQDVRSGLFGDVQQRGITYRCDTKLV